MERFNYPNIQAVLEEDASILRLIDCEQYGELALERREQEEEIARQQQEMNSQMARQG